MYAGGGNSSHGRIDSSPAWGSGRVKDRAFPNCTSTVGAEKAENLAATDVETHILDGGVAAKLLAEIAHLHECLCLRSERRGRQPRRRQAGLHYRGTSEFVLRRRLPQGKAGTQGLIRATALV